MVLKPVWICQVQQVLAAISLGPDYRRFSADAEPRMMRPMKSRLTKEEALSFLLTYLLVDRQQTFTMDQMTLFNLSNLAAEAESRLTQEEGLIPHEVIEALADQFIETL